MIKKAKTIEEVYAAFEPYPLNEKKQINDFFVDTYEARGTNAVKLMSLALEYSNNPYMKILFMGHRGSGKSTELSLLKEKIQQKFDVISFCIQDEVDTGNMTYIDFIFAIMAQIIKYVTGKPDLNFDEKDIEELYQYWYGEEIIEKSEVDSAEISAGFTAKLSFLNKGLVIIVEDLDKLSLDTAESLFIKYRKIWLNLQVRMILTFPIFMAYNSQYNMINEDIDLSCMLSLIKVRMPDKSVYEKGIETLTEIVEKRAELLLFDTDALRFMIEKSGGAIRDLFEMIRNASFDALLAGKQKITMKEAKHVYSQLKSRYERLIRDDKEVEKLVQIYGDPQLLTTDDTMMQLLLKGLALEYNGERWCGVHPTVEDFLKEKGKLGV